MAGKRSIENRLDELEGDTESSGITVAHRNPETDELRTSDGEPIDRDEISGVLIVLNESLVMPREQAEQEGRTILGPCEGAAEDAVRVPINSDEYPNIGW